MADTSVAGVIVAYAGRRAGSLGGDPEYVATRARRLLTAIRPSAVVGAAADGADLLVLESALAGSPGPGIHVVLPTARDVFAEDSVEAGWRDRFEAVLDAVTRRGGTVRSLDRDPGDAAYREANQAILDTARSLAGEAERVVALVVARAGEGQIIQDLQRRAGLATVPVLRIDPSVDEAERPRCFVAMPFGRKHDVQRRVDVNCDEVYYKVLVPALEHAQLTYRRADEEIDSGIVLEPMIEWLAHADLVIGDLGTGNFNVGWELGLRHLLRPAHTLLIGPAGTTAPFDLASLRHVRYHQDENGISDEHAIQAWSALAPYLHHVGDSAAVTGSDSPVAAVMEVRRWGEVERRTIPDQRWEGLRDMLAMARDLNDAEQMHAVLAAGEDLPEEQRRLLRAEAGVGLVRLERFADARPLLREMVANDHHLQRPEAHLYLAQSLYRPKSAPREDLDEAERLLKKVLYRRPGHPEVRALLGAVTKRRLRLIDSPAERLDNLHAAREYYEHDFLRNLNLYYEGVNVVALDTVLALAHHDASAGDAALELLPAVRVAGRLAAERPDERYWALASLAECTLHEHLLSGGRDATEVRAAYRVAGRMRPPKGDLDSSLTQLDLLAHLGLPSGPLGEARRGLVEGAARQV